MLVPLRSVQSCRLVISDGAHAEHPRLTSAPQAAPEGELHAKKHGKLKRSG
jgi:hypothetical protein